MHFSYTHCHRADYDQLKFERECLEEEVMITIEVSTTNHLQEKYLLSSYDYLKMFQKQSYVS